MKIPKFTEQERNDFEKIYQDYLGEGILLISYVGETPQIVKDQTDRWDKKIKERFGNDSEITKYLTRKAEGFITNIGM